MPEWRGNRLSAARSTVSANYLFPLGAGNHTFHMLARDLGSSVTPLFASRVISAVYIDQNGVGSS